jgi:hypothetical protein
MAKYASRSIIEAQAELFCWLDEKGPATQAEICAGLNWCPSKCKEVIYSKPEWLVATDKIRSKFGGISTLYHCKGEHKFGICPVCHQKNFHPSFIGIPCLRCSRGEKPRAPVTDTPSLMDGSTLTDARPGSEDKIEMLKARYEQGLDLWNAEDHDWSLPDDFQWEGQMLPQDDDFEDDD